MHAKVSYRPKIAVLENKRPFASVRSGITNVRCSVFTDQIQLTWSNFISLIKVVQWYSSSTGAVKYIRGTYIWRITIWIKVSWWAWWSRWTGWSLGSWWSDWPLLWWPISLKVKLCSCSRIVFCLRIKIWNMWSYMIEWKSGSKLWIKIENCGKI